MSEEPTVMIVPEDPRDQKGRFIPGHPPTPGAGRPKGTISITESIKKKLEEFYFDPLMPTAEKKTHLDKIIESIMHNAIVQKDQKALKDIWSYIDGLPKGSLEVGVDREGLAELTDFMKALANPKQNE